MGDFTKPEFWNESEEYIFISIFPGTRDFVNLFNIGSFITSADKILHVGCGPGDCVIELGQHIKEGMVYGIDFSEHSINIALEKLKSPTFIPQVMVWGRIMGLWHEGIIKDEDLYKFTLEMCRESKKDILSEIKNVYHQYIEIIKHYTLLSPYSTLTSGLKKLGLIDISTPLCYYKLIEGVKRFNDPIFEKIVETDIQKLQQVVKFDKMDAFYLLYPDNYFDKVFAREIEPLLRKNGSKWLDEMIRVCKHDGVILYGGFRLPGEYLKSDELESVISEIEKREKITLIEMGKRKLVSWWDPLFNLSDLNENVFTPYVIIKKD
ncbi:MAG: class I SAM-dependent methyltransferase [bacterium]